MAAPDNDEQLVMAADELIKSSEHPHVSVVVIGRNEGSRLVECLQSIAAISRRCALEVIYVDSNSTDGSPQRAAALGAQVLQVNPERPSAATGRNAGWRAARGEFVLFLDGDTKLHPDFVDRALPVFEDASVAVVCGHRREINPKQSFYVRVLDLDWVWRPGDVESCGGDALIRRSILVAVDGYDASLIAGEEPEMCRRIRTRGFRIILADLPMTTHDLAIRSFSSYWRRAFRTGHAYAEVSDRFRDTPDPLWRPVAIRNLLHGTSLMLYALAVLLLACWATPATLGAAGGLLGLAALVILRSTYRCGWKSSKWLTRFLYALHSHFQQIPILVGQVAQRLDARRGRQRRLIEYKDSGSLA